MRLGNIKPSRVWNLSKEKHDLLLYGKITISDLCQDDFRYELRQKGVDIKIGVDIASLAFQKMVHKIILISGDSDFVPAAKLARRNGIDFILDPMRNPIDPSLFEHIDGLRSTCPNPSKGQQHKCYII